LVPQLATAVDRASPGPKRPHTGWASEKMGSGQRQGDSSRTGKIAFIALKSLQNLRICHVPI
jgi:hypothetical protein